MKSRTVVVVIPASAERVGGNPAADWTVEIGLDARSALRLAGMTGPVPHCLPPSHHLATHDLTTSRSLGVAVHEAHDVAHDGV